MKTMKKSTLTTELERYPGDMPGKPHIALDIDGKYYVYPTCFDRSNDIKALMFARELNKRNSETA